MSAERRISPSMRDELVDASAAHGADAASCAKLTSLKLPHTTITVGASGSRGPVQGAGRQCVLRRSAGVLPRVHDHRSLERFRYQDRNLAAGRGLERQIPGGRERRLERVHSIRGAGDGVAARLRGRLDRHRARGRHGELRSRPSREADRFRLSRGARDGARRQGHHRCALRRGAALLVFYGLLGRRPAGVHGGAALSRGFRGHRRGRSRLRSRPPKACNSSPPRRPRTKMRPA